MGKASNLTYVIGLGLIRVQQVARLFTLKPRREIRSKTKKNTKIRRKICIYQKFAVSLQSVSVIFNKFFNLIVI